MSNVTAPAGIQLWSTDSALFLFNPVTFPIDGLFWRSRYIRIDRADRGLALRWKHNHHEHRTKDKLQAELRQASGEVLRLFDVLCRQGRLSQSSAAIVKKRMHSARLRCALPTPAPRSTLSVRVGAR